MRRLVSCTTCRRQYDATRRPVGSRFRCRCGATIEVRQVDGHTAAVVSCRSCGATRQQGAAACAYCGSDFTIHEQDLDTICPSCLARISDSARFCHHCATPIAPEEDAGDSTQRICPACGDGHTLRSRPIGEGAAAALECTRCAGLWLGEETFRLLGEQARVAADPFPDTRTIQNKMKDVRRTIPRQRGPIYRPCPVCETRMTRFNHGRQSGILLDRCPGHGTWFDSSELEAALAWIRIGGEKRTSETRARAERERASLDRFRVAPKVPESMGDSGEQSYATGGDWLAVLLKALSIRLE